ncbi:MAG: hypothetical protein ACPL4E_09745 [Thermoproteota archaeon]
MCLEENKTDLYENVKNSKTLLFVLVVMQTSSLFSTFRFLESMLRMVPNESPSKLKLEEYMRVTLMLQFPVALIYTSLPILTYLKLRRTYKTGRWSNMRAWFRLIGIFSLMSASGIFFMILIPFFGAFMLLSFPFLATGIILLCSLKHIK